MRIVLGSQLFFADRMFPVPSSRQAAIGCCCFVAKSRSGDQSSNCSSRSTRAATGCASSRLGLKGRSARLCASVGRGKVCTGSFPVGGTPCDCEQSESSVVANRCCGHSSRPRGCCILCEAESWRQAAPTALPRWPVNRMPSLVLYLLSVCVNLFLFVCSTFGTFNSSMKI